MRTRRLFLYACAALLLVAAVLLIPKLLLLYQSTAYVLGYANDPAGGPYKVTFGTDRPDEMRGGTGDDLLASEGRWGDPPEDYGPDRVSAGRGDDFIDTVSLPYPEELPVDVVRCGSGEDRAVADPQDEVSADCEGVRRIDMGLLPEIGDPLWEFPPESGTRQYGPHPGPMRSLD